MSDLDAHPDEPPQNLRDRAYRAFTASLLNQDIRPGQFISQREMVAITGFPLGAIREMIPRLEAEGLLRTIPQRGMQIAHVDLSLIRDAFQFRLFIEREAIHLFVRSVSDTDLARIRATHEAILDRAQNSVDADLIEDAQNVDWGFHDELVDSLGNSIVSNHYRVNSIKIRLVRQLLIRLDPDIVAPVMRDHLKIIAALEARDGQSALSELSRHIDNARLRALGI